MPVSAWPCLAQTCCPSGSTQSQQELGCRENWHCGMEHGDQTSPRGTAQHGTSLPPMLGTAQRTRWEGDFRTGLRSQNPLFPSSIHLEFFSSIKTPLDCCRAVS